MLQNVALVVIFHFVIIPKLQRLARLKVKISSRFWVSIETSDYMPLVHYQINVMHNTLEIWTEMIILLPPPIMAKVNKSFLSSVVSVRVFVCSVLVCLQNN